MDIHIDKEQYSASASAMIEAIDNSGVRMFMYYPQKKTVNIPEKTCAAYQCKSVYTDMPNSFLEDYVYIDDYDIFKEMYYKIENGEKMAMSTFHSKDMKYYNHVTLTTISCTEDGLPKEVIGIIEDKSELYKNEQVIKELQDTIYKEKVVDDLEVIASSIGSQYYALYYIDLVNHTYSCFQEQLPGILSRIGETGYYKPAWETYINDYIDSKDQSGMRDFSDITTLAKRIGTQKSISRNYRRKNIGWTRGQYIAGKRDDKGNLLTVIYTVADIENEVKQKKEKEKAVFKAQHDSLTGLLNRSGLDAIMANRENLSDKVGVALIDIDNFKQINDRHGHNFGDDVLISVAQNLQQVFAKEDAIIRLGGDEFMILFDKVGLSLWKGICRKIQSIHNALFEEYSGYEDVSVTLSVGLCLSEIGYYEDLYNLADEALYRTKNSGRAGCTLIDYNHNIVKQWQDESLSMKSRSVLAYNNTGICQIEIPFDETKARRLICGESVKALMGVAIDTTPEDCYQIWKTRIDSTYKNVMQETEQSMIQNGQTECTYLWNHPEWGNIYIRSGGFGKVEEDKILLCGYIHSLKDTRIIEKKDDTMYLLEALNDVHLYSYYIDLEDMSYSAYKIANRADCLELQKGALSEIVDKFINGFVAPSDRNKMQEFMDLSTLEQRLDGKKAIDCEYKRHTVKGWYRAKFVPVKYNENGKLTHVLFLIISLDSEREKELDLAEYNKKSLESLFDNVPGGIVLYEWNGERLKVLHMSKYYKEMYGYSMLNDSDSPDFLRIHPDDVADYKKAILKALTETHKIEYAFRVWNPKKEKYGWTQVNAISEVQEDGNSLVYAMYSDITIQKELELLSEKRQRMIESNYRKQIQKLIVTNPNMLCRFKINLTANQFSDMQSKICPGIYSAKAKTLDEFMQLTSNSVGGEKAKKEYCNLFNCNNLLELYKNGQSHISYECYYHFTESHTEWIEVIFDLVTEPETNHIVGVCYVRSKNEEKMSRIILDTSLEKNYPLAVLIYADTGEYYRYERAKGEHCKHCHNYWEKVAKWRTELVDTDAIEEISSKFSKEKIMSVLEKADSYAYSFYAHRGEKNVRLEVKYQYADREQKLLLAVLHDITDTALYEQYKYDSEHDSLTGLSNRESIFKKSRNLLKEHPEEQFVIVHGDVRHFHLYNTFFGEEAGDRLLCKIADIMRTMDKDYEYWAYGRMEADVFCAFFPVRKDLFEKHVQYLHSELATISDKFAIEAAIGAYWVTDLSMSMEEMFSRATIAAKSGKKNLFNLISKYDVEMDHELMDTQEITSEMSYAILKEQFEVYLQPKYCLKTKKITGAEALVRWNHPDHGLISPGKFIPVFEKNGFITELDRYMWEHVCKILQRWKKEGKKMFPVSVNISRVSMYSHATVPFLKSLIEKYDLDPQYLELELTETAYMDDPKELKRMLMELQEYGFKILMDDFGSGYSSLNTLKDLPVDILKLDMKFLEGALNNTRAGAVLSSVVRMSKMLNLPIIAEGIEQKEQAEYLESIGCEYVQGFLFARPMPVEDYEKLAVSES